MDEVTRRFYLQTFKWRWHTDTGTEFQDLFAEVMQNAWPQDFQKIRPYGPRGDMKCDGYLASRKRVFQCYGPRSMREDAVISKVGDDFEGAKEHWGERMQEWCFTHNDRDGLSAGVVQVLGDLRLANPGIEINEWAWPQARKEFDRLGIDSLVEIFGYAPSSSTLDRLSFEEISPVIDEIAKGDPDPYTSLSDPPSVKKLEKNDLDDDSAEFLRLGRRRVRVVEDFFSQHYDPTLGDKIAKAFQKQYKAFADAGLNANEVLFELQRFAGWGARSTNNHDAAVLAILTYFFDRCDIFEDPQEIGTAGEPLP